MLARLRELTPQEVASYAEREPAEAAVAEFLRIQSGEMLLTNGVDEAIHLLCETFLEPQDEVLIPVPTFVMYEISAAATGARVIAVPADYTPIQTHQVFAWNPSVQGAKSEDTIYLGTDGPEVLTVVHANVPGSSLEIKNAAGKKLTDSAAGSHHVVSADTIENTKSSANFDPKISSAIKDHMDLDELRAMTETLNTSENPGLEK